jgi:S1-C subfamily serine protease
MAIELRILTGARGGHHERFDAPTIALGRHLDSDLRFDPNKDLDVSAHHAEIVAGTAGTYRLRDCGSTNGTFVNGNRITGDEPLASGDVIWLGAEGPQVQVTVLPATAAAVPAARPADGDVVKQPVPSKTQERSAPTARPPGTGLQRILVVCGVLLVLMLGGSAVSYWISHRPARAAVNARNDAAIAFLVSELDGKPYGGTAFGVSSTGLLVTNKHNVRAPFTGHAPTRLGVKYANTDVLLHAHLVEIAADSADLALVQVDEPGTYPIVAGVARSLDDVRPGTPVVTIGFPHALDLPMQGNVVKTSLTSGTVSKLLPDVMQIDGYASHGSSGSPIFDVRGWVIGVVYGGEAESQGRLTYAVPSTKLSAMLGTTAASVLRP